jgi:hypothetical protein
LVKTISEAISKSEVFTIVTSSVISQSHPFCPSKWRFAVRQILPSEFAPNLITTTLIYYDSGLMGVLSPRLLVLICSTWEQTMFESLKLIAKKESEGEDKGKVN